MIGDQLIKRCQMIWNGGKWPFNPCSNSYSVFSAIHSLLYFYCLFFIICCLFAVLHTLENALLMNINQSKRDIRNQYKNQRIHNPSPEVIHPEISGYCIHFNIKKSCMIRNRSCNNNFNKTYVGKMRKMFYFQLELEDDDEMIKLVKISVA